MNPPLMSEPGGGTSRVRSTPSCRNRYQLLGQVGKKNLKKILDQQLSALQRALLHVLLVTSVAAGCQKDLGEPLQSGQVLALHGLQGRWVGSVVPDATSCGPETHGLLSIGEDGFGFDPFQSTTIIHGRIDDGHLRGTLVRQGADHREVSIAFQAVASTSDQINGTLQSGRCRWTVMLRRG